MAQRGHVESYWAKHVMHVGMHWGPADGSRLDLCQPLFKGGRMEKRMRRWKGTRRLPVTYHLQGTPQLAGVR